MSLNSTHTPQDGLSAWVPKAKRPIRGTVEGQFDDCEDETSLPACFSPPDFPPVDNELRGPIKLRSKLRHKTRALANGAQTPPPSPTPSESDLTTSDAGESSSSTRTEPSSCPSMPATPGENRANGVTGFDVLSGRGNGTNHHAGNRFLRYLCGLRRPDYVIAAKPQKREIVLDIVASIRYRGGRFLKKDEATGKWYDIGDEKAAAKTSQALREGVAEKRRALGKGLASDLRQTLTTGSSAPPQTIQARMVPCMLVANSVEPTVPSSPISNIDLPFLIQGEEGVSLLSKMNSGLVHRIALPDLNLNKRRRVSFGSLGI